MTELQGPCGEQAGRGEEDESSVLTEELYATPGQQCNLPIPWGKGWLGTVPKTTELEWQRVVTDTTRFLLSSESSPSVPISRKAPKTAHYLRTHTDFRQASGGHSPYLTISSGNRGTQNKIGRGDHVHQGHRIIFQLLGNKKSFTWRRPTVSRATMG